MFSEGLGIMHFSWHEALCWMKRSNCGLDKFERIVVGSLPVMFFTQQLVLNLQCSLSPQTSGWS